MKVKVMTFDNVVPPLGTDAPLPSTVETIDVSGPSVSVGGVAAP
jgi:hypothetical protein